jgi:DNA repair protein RecO (recombination protein O)
VPPEYRTRALVLRTFDQGESDRVVHLYTERLGRVSAIAKGARRSKRRFPGTLEIFSVLDVRLVDPPRASLMRLEGARLVQPLEGLTEELGRYAIGCHFLELLDRITTEGDANPELFRFVVGVLDVVRCERPDRLLALLVQLKLLARLGYRPQLLDCALCGGALRGPRAAFSSRHGGAVCGACAPADDPGVSSGLLAALERGIRSPLRERSKLGLAAADVSVAERLVNRFFQFHIGFEPRSGVFLRQALAGAQQLDDPLGRGDTPAAPAPGV